MKTEEVRATQTSITPSSYPISLSAISAKVARKNGRRKRPERDAHQPGLFVHQSTESVSSHDYRIRHQIDVEASDSVIQKIFERDPRRAYIAFKYLDDMQKNLSEVYSALRDGGRYIIVVGNNRIRGQLFESWKYLMTLAENIGFHIENYFGSEIIKHFIKIPREEQINTDWILVLRK